MNLEPEHEMAIRDAVISLNSYYEETVFSERSARELIVEFLEILDSEHRDFSDEMLEARKTFRKLTTEQPDECPSKLWDDALQSVGRS